MRRKTTLHGLRLTRGEYWLLESVATLRLPLAWLVSSELELRLNKLSHDMDEDELVRTLCSLHRRGLIALTRRGGRRQAVTPRSLRAAMEVAPRSPTCYGLTAAGGAAWEAFARPRWSQYVDHTIDYDGADSRSHEMLCLDRERLAWAFQHLFPGRTDLEDVEQSVIRPWRATYWKRFSAGHRLRFRERLEEAERHIPGRFLPDSWYWPR